MVSIFFIVRAGPYYQYKFLLIEDRHGYLRAEIPSPSILQNARFPRGGRTCLFTAILRLKPGNKVQPRTTSHMPPPGGGSPRSLVIVTTVLILPILSPDRRGCPVFVENSHLGIWAATDELLCDLVPWSIDCGGSCYCTE